MVDLNAHEAGNGGQSQGKPTTRGVLLYSEREGPPRPSLPSFDQLVGPSPSRLSQLQTKKEYSFQTFGCGPSLTTLAGLKPPIVH